MPMLNLGIGYVVHDVILYFSVCLKLSEFNVSQLT